MAIKREVEKNITIDESNAKLIKTKMIPHKNGLFYDESAILLGMITMLVINLVSGA